MYRREMYKHSRNIETHSLFKTSNTLFNYNSSVLFGLREKQVRKTEISEKREMDEEDVYRSLGRSFFCSY